MRPLRKLRWLCCQFCLILAERNHGRPSRRGYAPRASSASTTTQISNKCLLIMMDNFRKRPRGRTERVSAIRSQEGRFSYEVMLRLLQMALLMTFTPEPPSTTHPVISVPCTKTLIAGFWWSMTVGPWLGSIKRVGIALCGVCRLDSMAPDSRVCSLSA